jgi:hypothetical protein
MAIYSKIYDEADAIYARMNGRSRIVVDLAFSSMGHPSLITSNQNTNNWHCNHALNNEATAVRQMSEWGMRGFQSLFPCAPLFSIYYPYTNKIPERADVTPENNPEEVYTQYFARHFEI